MVASAMYSSLSHLTPLALTLCAAYSMYLLLSRVFSLMTDAKLGLPLPPGPKGLPLIGSLFDMPTEQQWIKAAEWAKEYGDVFHVEVLGQHLVYLNTYEAASDLLERRSSKYSGRVQTEMSKMIRVAEMLALMPVGDNWRTGRRMIHQEFNSNTVVKYFGSQLQHCRTLLRQIYQTPESFENHIKHYSGGTLLESVFGLPIQSNNDPYIRCGELAMTSLEALLTGVYIVDFLPFLRHLPAWMPGATFKRKALTYRQHVRDIGVLPFKAARENMALGTSSGDNMVKRWTEKIDALSDKEERRRLEHLLSLVSGAALAGGAESTAYTLLVYVYLMAVHPDVQAKMQAELDSVIGRARLPDFSDREALPYINAVCKELMRWHPIVPLGVPHGSTMEDDYRGMRIPCGSIIVPNVWVMVRDKTVYGEDADTFRPERFLESDLRDPNRMVFGFGRRICPGRYLAENSIFLAVSSLVHLFKIGKALDEDGGEITPGAKWISGLAVHLEPYPCSIVPRFEGVGELLKEEEDS